MYFAGEAKVRLNRYSIEYLGYSDKEIDYVVEVSNS